jgi:Ras-related protein Rab-8A
MSDEEEESVPRSRSRRRSHTMNEDELQLEGPSVPGLAPSAGASESSPGRAAASTATAGGTAAGGARMVVSARTQNILSLKDFQPSPYGLGGEEGLGMGGAEDEEVSAESEERRLELAEEALRAAAGGGRRGLGAKPGSRDSSGTESGGEEAPERAVAASPRSGARAGGAGGGRGGGGERAGGAGGAAGEGSVSGAAGAAAGGPAGGAGEEMVVLKLLMLGDGGVGKSSLVQRFSHGKFDPDMISTMGVAFEMETLRIGGRSVRCDIWDTAGQERFRAITRAYYARSHGIILVYDVSDKDRASFHNVQYWMENIAQHASSNVVKVLIGNKIDRKDEIHVTTAEGKAAADKYGVPFFEASAKTGDGVVPAFHAAVKEALRKYLEERGEDLDLQLAAEGDKQDGDKASSAQTATAASKKCVIA